MRARFALVSALILSSCEDGGSQVPEATETASEFVAPEPESIPSPTPTALTPEQMREGRNQLRKLEADDIARLTEGDARAKKLAWQAEYNKSGVYTEYTKRLGILWAARVNSKRAVDCNLRSDGWRNMLLAMMQNQIYSDRSFMMLTGSLTEGEKLAADASEKLSAHFYEADKIDCDDLREMPFMKAYDLVAAGVGTM